MDNHPAQCVNCKYWKPPARSQNPMYPWGSCYLPCYLDLVTGRDLPLTKPSDWCAEWTETEIAA